MDLEPLFRLHIERTHIIHALVKHIRRFEYIILVNMM